MDFKKCLLIIFVHVLFFDVSYAQNETNKFLSLSGPYLGQKLPGMTPELFAPEFISTENFCESCYVFTLDGKMFLFNRRPPSESHKTIFMTTLKKADRQSRFLERF